MAPGRRLQEHPGERPGGDPAGPHRAPGPGGRHRGLDRQSAPRPGDRPDLGRSSTWSDDGTPDSTRRSRATARASCSARNSNWRNGFPDPDRVHAQRIDGSWQLSTRDLTSDGVLTGHAGGDSGLFPGILASYLALVAPGCRRAPPQTPPWRPRHRRGRWCSGPPRPPGPTRPWSTDCRLFGPDWSRPARVPTTRGAAPERDLSVQLSGWMLMEAAA